MLIIANLGKMSKREGITKYPEFSHVRRLSMPVFIGEKVNLLHFPALGGSHPDLHPSLPPSLQGRIRPSSNFLESPQTSALDCCLRPSTQPLTLQPPFAQHLSTGSAPHILRYT